MKKFLVVAALYLGIPAAHAQEKLINIMKTDGTKDKIRVADMKQISFLTVEEGGQGLLVKTMSGETTAVLFEAHPVVTFANGKMTVKSNTAETVVFEIENIVEITFGNSSDPSGIDNVEDFAYVLQDSGVLLRGIPKGTQPRIYSIDGRLMSIPAVTSGELRLSRATLGTGTFIIKAGKFTTKILL